MATSRTAARTRPDDALLEESRVLSGKLIAVAERAKQDFGAIAAELGLTALQARTLLWLGEARAMSEVAEHLGCDGSNVTGLADRLARNGLVERVPGEDRRVRLLQLTDEGRRLRTRLARRVAASSTVTSRLTGPQRAQLSRLLDALLD